MARYIAVQPIHFGTALAFAAGAQVPEDHVERFGYLDAGWVQQVADDHRGDAPDLIPAVPDNTPPSMAIAARYVDEAAHRVAEAQRDFTAAQVAGIAANAEEADRPDEPPAESDGDAAKTTARTAPKAKPSTGDTTTPVKEH